MKLKSDQTYCKLPEVSSLERVIFFRGNRLIFERLSDCTCPTVVGVLRSVLFLRHQQNS